MEWIQKFAQLSESLAGEVRTDSLSRSIYATDASPYEVVPQAVAFPRTVQDIRTLVQFASRHSVGLIPRAAGTSLAGQVVGQGIVVDISKHFGSILEVNESEKWVRVQPGVIRNELNQFLEPHELFFGPETSTQNRAMIGGMLGNNSCGANSLQYGSVRDHVLEITVVLSDGSTAKFGQIDRDELESKCRLDNLEGKIYRQLRNAFEKESSRDKIAAKFPGPSVVRRNAGYALDCLAQTNCFTSSSSALNLCKLIAGSEGTLCFVTEVKLSCCTLPPKESALVCANFESVSQAMNAVGPSLDANCYSCELIDRNILQATARSLEHRENRIFIEGDPDAVLVIELRDENETNLDNRCHALIETLKRLSLGSAYPIVKGLDQKRVWALRKAGLGLLANSNNDETPVTVIEDTAVSAEDLPRYVEEVDRLLESLEVRCVRYAHAGAGEIHFRPFLNLKTESGKRKFRAIAEGVSELVKKYGGSLSGEHGDGRLRSEFLKSHLGDEIYALMEEVKQTWDPNQVFNPGKIICSTRMDEELKVKTPRRDPLPTLFDWSDSGGMLGGAERCSGSGDCRKTHLSGGTMCPSYMATRDEKDSTRARANRLRQVLSSSHVDPIDQEDLKLVLDLCLSCKACKRECPSSVDMAKLKAEFTQRYFDEHGTPRRNKRSAALTSLLKSTSHFPRFWNWVFQSPITRTALPFLGIHAHRSLPLLPAVTLEKWFGKHEPHPNSGKRGELLLFNCEITNYLESHVGIAAVELMERMGFSVKLLSIDSARARLSNGLVRQAKKIINENLAGPLATATGSVPIVGLEPSTVLTYRDESLVLCDQRNKDVATEIADRTWTFEEWMSKQLEDQDVKESFGRFDRYRVHYHGHCFEKALSKSRNAEWLRLDGKVNLVSIPSGCCGMAGSFGFEKEHFELSMKIGELVLLPAVRELELQDLVLASGTSCRHQIKDGTGRIAKHPAEFLRELWQE